MISAMILGGCKKEIPTDDPVVPTETTVSETAAAKEALTPEELSLIHIYVGGNLCGDGVRFELE